MTTLTELRSEKLINLFSWLLPVTYLIHIAEEYWGGEGYPAYIHRLRGVHLSSTKFLVAQGIGFVLVTAGIILARRFHFPALMLVIVNMAVLGNAITHTVNAALTRSYHPGLWSSLLIWMPMGLFVLVRFNAAMSKARYWTAIAIGIGINVVIGVITMRGGKLI